ncbi:MAG: M24 family metallopeptidase [Gemmatimonadota bacterium]
MGPPKTRDTPLAARRAGLRERLASAGGSALLVVHPPNICYLSGFRGGGALLLTADGPDTLFVVPMNEAEARGEVGEDVAVAVATRRPLETAREHLAGNEGVVAFEKDRLSVAQHEAWESAGGSPLEGVSGWVEGLRVVKSTPERETIARAAGIAVDAFEAVLPEIRPGVTELQLAARLERELREQGSERFPFDTIVQFGERAALPHAEPGGRPLARGEVALFDFGAVVDGYVSDVSRTVSCGSPDPRLSEAYRVVDLARRAALDGLRGGIEARRADALARDVIEEGGYGPAFTHSLGHGIGLEVHEDPRLWKENGDPVPAGAVVTLEPGIYIQGLGGIRIEDDFVVGAAGARALARPAPDELVVL